MFSKIPIYNMEPNHYYCRSAMQQDPSTSAIPINASNKINYGMNSGQEYVACSPYQSQSGYNFKDTQRNANNHNKSLSGNSSMGSPFAAGCNSSGQCNKNAANAGNYINIMTVPLGTLQYNRKKLSSQDYESHLYYNTTDFKCRDTYYNTNNTGHLNTGSTIPQHQNQQPQQPNCLHIQHSLAQNHQLSHTQPIHQLPQLSTSTANPNNDFESCAMFPPATESHQNKSNVAMCEQAMSQAATSMGSVNVPAPPIMYTVHRVVTTAQIQTAIGGSFASSASVSSVVSTGKNESDCLASSQLTSAMTASPHGPCHSGLTDMGANILNNASALCPMPDVRSPAGVLNNSSFLQAHQKCNNGNEAQPMSALPKRVLGTSSTSNLASAGKPTSNLGRALQNVIPTCVYLMSRVAVHMEIEGTAECPSQVMLAAALGCEELGISNKLLAQSVFGLWMTSTLLEMQLKAHHCPYIVRVAWPNLLQKFSNGSPSDQKYDEPMIVLKRNVFFSKRDEEKIKDYRILELLYEEARNNVLIGRYIMEPVHSLMLGGIQARIELGPYNSHTHTVGFFRENQARFLPALVAKSSNWLWLPISQKNSAEVKLLEQFKRVPQTATTRKLMRKYLEFCWALPFYGAAFFHGQMEQPVRGIMALVNQKDMEVLIAVNERGVYVIDPYESTLLLGLRYEDLSWDYAKPSAADDAECLTCIFLQFDAVENGIQVSKLVQVFSKQAAMIDALISHFTDQIRNKKQEGNSAEPFHDEPNPIQNNGNGVLCNKLSRLTLATFDEEGGRCIGQMGSLSISY
ncbi:FERM domain-containing protein 8 [Drosophila guanche]|uniref:FERM domain-containing protein 8 n=1 Tax=Drosophila guanche TaxID=7266 RepID=A0A3B0KDY1_DROGU|nr:FERM domain-containing protein 8 [Drosophila guanche]SPP83231.1 blast:FERM domain-containing protein 8 [Drosophila guanche]